MRSHASMKITRFETFLAGAGLRNYLFIRVTTDTGLCGVGEATLEWQEQTVRTLCHEWLEDRVLGRDPFDVETLTAELVRDQYQGGSTVMTAISGVEIALWDLVGKARGKSVCELLGGTRRERLPAYANGWYGGARTPREFAERARDVKARGYRAMKFDPLETAWLELSADEMAAAVERVAKVREAVGDDTQLMIEFHGRLSASAALDFMRLIARYRPAWCEEPVAPEQVELLAEVRAQSALPIAAGERLVTEADFERMFRLRSVDVVQMDICHCGGLAASKRIAASAARGGVRVAPHCSIGPVALAAALHFDAATPNFLIQESFAEFDVPWRDQLVSGWNSTRAGECQLPPGPGLGIELDLDAIAEHPYVAHAFPSLWDREWTTKFTQNDPESR
jgi:galactonate dehydratase